MKPCDCEREREEMRAILAALSASKQHTINSLAATVGLSRPRTVTLVRRMKKRGFIKDLGPYGHGLFLAIDYTFA